MFQCHIKTRGKNLHQPPKWNGQQGGKKVLKWNGCTNKLLEWVKLDLILKLNLGLNLISKKKVIKKDILLKFINQILQLRLMIPI